MPSVGFNGIQAQTYTFLQNPLLKRLSKAFMTMLKIIISLISSHLQQNAFCGL